MKKLLKKNDFIFLFFASSVIVLIISILSRSMMSSSATMIEEASKLQMVALSKAAALIVTAEELDVFVEPDDVYEEDYLELKKKLIQFTEESGLAYTYYLRLDTETNMMQFIIDNSDEDASALALPQVAREHTPDIALSGTAAAVDVGSYSDGWEGYISAFAPVYYSDGTLSNTIAGVDMQDIYIKLARDNITMLSTILILSMFAVLGICMVCLLLYSGKVRQAESASATKSYFLSNMSHEIRTPMNAIIGMTEIARGNTNPERVQYCLEKINVAAGHLLGVINDILDLSKIEAGKYSLSQSDFVFEDMLKRIITVINFKVDEKRQNFIIRIARDVPEAIVSDQQRLTQVITNLLTNAVKFTPERGEISLDIHMIKEVGDVVTLRFEVIDTGIGISQAQQAELFRPFQQADGSISRRFGGTGLGLAISKNIVELMNGSIWVESELHKGSKFIFTIEAKRGAAVSKVGFHSNIDWSSVRVLVVSGIPEERQYFQEVAAGAGIACRVANNSYDADHLVSQSYEYHIMFIDPDILGAKGLELVRTLKQTKGDSVHIVIISTNDWDQKEEYRIDKNVDSYISRPLIPSIIIDCINNQLMDKDRILVESTAAYSNDNIFAGKTILLAEDVDINREILISALEDTAVSIDCAENGQIACNMFEKTPELYDLILMDIQMPEMDGYQATREIRAMEFEKARTVPIVAMTANVFSQDIERCMEAGMNDHVGKPIEFDEVIEKLKQYLIKN